MAENNGNSNDEKDVIEDTDFSSLAEVNDDNSLRSINDWSVDEFDDKIENVIGKKTVKVQTAARKKSGRVSFKEPNKKYLQRNFELEDSLNDRLAFFLFKNKQTISEYLNKLVGKDLDENAPETEK
jgi:hypothetical protein